MRNDIFSTVFSLFPESKRFVHPPPPVGLLFRKIRQPLYLLHLKYPSIHLFLSALFEMFWSVPIWFCNLWLLLYTPWLMYLFVSQPFIHFFFLNAGSKVDICFALFEFVALLLWETITFYWIIWWTHNRDPMGITLFK